MTDQALRTEAEELEALRLAAGELTHRLEVANLRVDVAVDVIPLIDQLVEDHNARSVVVTDIVDCWLQLEPAVQKEYSKRGHGATPVGHFAADYADEVQLTWVQPDTQSEPYDQAAEQMDRLQWRIYVAQVQQRNILGEPPGEEWLARFPLPVDRTG